MPMSAISRSTRRRAITWPSRSRCFQTADDQGRADADQDLAFYDVGSTQLVDGGWRSCASGPSDFVEPVRRAQAVGQLRADFVPENFVLLLIANAGVVRGTREPRHDGVEVLRGTHLDGCQPRELTLRRPRHPRPGVPSHAPAGPL